MEAINTLSKILNLTAKDFGFAGNKDKRAITVQRVSIHKVTKEWVLEKFNVYNSRQKGHFKDSIQLGEFSYNDDHVKLGDLKGNHFEIVIRYHMVSFDLYLLFCVIVISNHQISNLK